MWSKTILVLLMCAIVGPWACAQDSPPTPASHPSYVLDWWRHRILQMDDPTGTNLKELGVDGKGVGQFRSPRGLFVDVRQRIYVCDTENHRIVRMDDITGKGWVELGRLGSGEREFRCPASLFVEDNGRITVMDVLNKRIVQMDDMTGRHWKTLAVPEIGDRNKDKVAEPQARLRGLQVTNVVVDRQGRLYYPSTTKYCVIRVDGISGHGRTYLGTPGKRMAHFEENLFWAPLQVELDTLGRIYVLDVPGSIVRVDDMTGKNWTRIYAPIPGARSFSVVGSNTVYIASWGPIDTLIERRETPDGKATFIPLKAAWMETTGGSLPLLRIAP